MACQGNAPGLLGAGPRTHARAPGFQGRDMALPNELGMAAQGQRDGGGPVWLHGVVRTGTRVCVRMMSRVRHGVARCGHGKTEMDGWEQRRDVRVFSRAKRARSCGRDGVRAHTLGMVRV